MNLIACPPANNPVAVLLYDLACAGVTDAIAETPYNWQQPLRSQPSKAQAATPQTPVPLNTQEVSLTFQPTSQPAKAAPKPQASKPSVSEQWQVGTAQELLIITDGTNYTKGKLPFTDVEKTLLNNMLKAIGLFGLNLDTMAVLAVDDAAPHSAKLPENMPAKVLCLSGVAAQMRVQETLTLSQARQHDVTGMTYHPRTLLKQPLLKQQAWADLLRWQASWAKGQ